MYLVVSSLPERKVLFASYDKNEAIQKVQLFTLRGFDCKLDYRRI